MSDLKVYKDVVAEKLDEMADLCEYWKKNREKGHEPNAIRQALISISEEILMNINIKKLETLRESLDKGN